MPMRSYDSIRTFKVGIVLWPKKKNTLVSGNAGMTRKIFSQAAAIFFYRFSADTLSSSVVSFAFFDSCFFGWFVYFFKFKICILIQIRICGRVSEKYVSPDRFPETRLLLLWP